MGGRSRPTGTLEPSLLANYAAFIGHRVHDPADYGQSRLFDFEVANAQREACEGLGALALTEAVAGHWADAFRHVETTKALDHRQRATLLSVRADDLAGLPETRTTGHDSWEHGVPPADAGGPPAQLTTYLARRLATPSPAQRRRIATR